MLSCKHLFCGSMNHSMNTLTRITSHPSENSICHMLKHSISRSSLQVLSNDGISLIQFIRSMYPTYLPELIIDTVEHQNLVALKYDGILYSCQRNKMRIPGNVLQMS